jgi:hypothetical protein
MHISVCILTRLSGPRAGLHPRQGVWGGCPPVAQSKTIRGGLCAAAAPLARDIKPGVSPDLGPDRRRSSWASLERDSEEGPVAVSAGVRAEIDRGGRGPRRGGSPPPPNSRKRMETWRRVGCSSVPPRATPCNAGAVSRRHLVRFLASDSLRIRGSIRLSSIGSFGGGGRKLRGWVSSR